jgi:hypothetical protein
MTIDEGPAPPVAGINSTDSVNPDHIDHDVALPLATQASPTLPTVFAILLYHCVLLKMLARGGDKVLTLKHVGNIRLSFI